MNLDWKTYYRAVLLLLLETMLLLCSGVLSYYLNGSALSTVHFGLEDHLLLEQFKITNTIRRDI
jgi:hypothetical protein